MQSTKASICSIAPEANHLAWNADSFIRHLRRPDDARLLFHRTSLEQIVSAIAVVGDSELARALHRRYCDYWLIDGELELHLAGTAPSLPVIMLPKPMGQTNQA